MNSKLMKAGIAGAAVVALAAGGGTFAAWSDFGTQNIQAGAGILKLNLNDQKGTDTNVIQPFSLAPGEHKVQDFFLASADAANVPDGVLTAYINNVNDTEDTAAGTCTTASEAAAEGTTNCASNGGELTSELNLVVGTLPADTVADCSHYSTLLYGTAPFSGVVGTANALTLSSDLKKGKGVCMYVDASLPTTADNKVQGDQASWDWHFDLTQVTTP